MAKNRKEPKHIKLRQPDRSGPSEKTLLDLAGERSLFEQADRRQRELRGEKLDDADEDEDAKLSPGAERFLEALLYTTTLAMLHFMFDVLVNKQYAAELKWKRVITNAARAWIVFFFLFYTLHPSHPDQTLIPFLPRRFQKTLRQMLFFAISCVAGCSLVYVTNSKGYLYNMKRAPPLGCLWLWAVVELDLLWAVPSLAVAAFYLWVNGYSIK